MSDTGFLRDPTTTLADLELFVPDTAPARQDVGIYDFVQDGLQPGGRVKRRQIAESNYMDDAFQLQSSKARPAASFGLFVTGRTQALLKTYIDELLTMVDLPTWEMHVLFGGSVEYAWSCWDAEPVVGFPVAVWHGDAFFGYMAPVSIATSRSPIPVVGPI